MLLMVPETITVSKGDDSVTLKLDTKKSGVSITSTPAITTIPNIDTTLAANLTFVASKIQEKVNGQSRSQATSFSFRCAQ